MVGAGSNNGAASVAERLDHLGIVARICRKIGLVAWLDAQDEGSPEHVRVRISTVATILNGLTSTASAASRSPSAHHPRRPRLSRPARRSRLRCARIGSSPPPAPAMH